MKEENFAKPEGRDLTSKLRKNPWIASTFVFAAAALILLFLAIKPEFTGNVISGDDAGNKLVDFAKTKGINLELVSVSDKGSYYEVEASINGETDAYPVTKDGKYMIGGLISLTGNTVAEEKPTEITKSDKPKVELFVFSYCPYGLQAEKGFVPVYNLLKNKADLDIKFIGAMHGKYEETESLRQLCIKKNYGKDKFMDYILSFASDTAIGSCGSNEACSKPLAEKIMSKLGIDIEKINSCMINDAPALYSADEAEASQLGVSGSPTLVINGAIASSGRSSSAFLASICSAFNTQPGECSQTLSSANPSPGFSSSSSSSSGASSCG